MVVEEYLDGPEVSLFCLTDGDDRACRCCRRRTSSALGDGDTGPNTGGMGAYAPLPWLPAGAVDEVVRDGRAADGRPRWRRRGTPFAGLLYIGLALTADGPRVVEFNARFGDPETQVVLALLETPLAALLHAAATGRLAEHPPLRWRDGAAVTVVLAAAGYPGDAAHRRRDHRRRRSRACCTPAPAAATTAPSSPAAGGCCRSPRSATTWPTPARAPTRCCAGIELPGGQYRSDIAAGGRADQVGARLHAARCAPWRVCTSRRRWTSSS